MIKSISQMTSTIKDDLSTRIAIAKYHVKRNLSIIVAMTALIAVILGGFGILAWSVMYKGPVVTFTLTNISWKREAVIGNWEVYRAEDYSVPNGAKNVVERYVGWGRNEHKVYSYDVNVFNQKRSQVWTGNGTQPNREQPTLKDGEELKGIYISYKITGIVNGEEVTYQVSKDLFNDVKKATIGETYRVQISRYNDNVIAFNKD